MREAMRTRHYSPRTERTYCHWVKQFVFFHGKQHPAEMGEPEINRFLTHLATERHVSSSTQNQALSAILFLYRSIVGREVGDLGGVARARRPRRLPVVLTREEVRLILEHLSDVKWLMASLMYGAGLRLMERLRLRVQDLDIGANQSIVRDGKGSKDRVTMLPEKLKGPLQEQLRRVQQLHVADLADGWGRVEVPDALARKYANAPTDWRRSSCFPRIIDGRTRRPERKGGITSTSQSCRRQSGTR